MKSFIRNYLKILALTITALVFVLTSFYFIMNYYHSEELKRQIYISENDINYKNYKEKLASINTNLIKFRNIKNPSNDDRKMYDRLVTCYNSLDSFGTLSKMNVNTYHSSKEIHDLGSKFESYVLNNCWATNLSFLKQDDVPEKYKAVAPFISNYVNTISSQIDNSLSEIENNGSYFYSTNISSATIRNYLTSDYSMIARSYNDFASIVLELSFNVI